MNFDFDFNINNYNIPELKDFLKINDDKYTLNDVDQKCSKMKSIIYENKQYDKNYKTQISKFLDEVKIKLVSHIKKISKEDDGFIEDYDSMIVTTGDVTENDSKNDSKNDSNNKSTDKDDSYNNVGKIINPMSVHPSLQKASIPSNTVNAYSGNQFVTNYVFNTQFRDNFFFTQPENCTFTLPIKIKNVVAISLSAVQIPNVMLTFSSVRGTNQIYIYEEETGLEGIVTIPNGNYDYTSFPTILQEAINLQIIGSLPGRFTVSINPYTFFTTISNSTYNFRMDIMGSNDSFLGMCDKYKYYTDANPDNIVYKNKINVEPSKFVSTMGYLIGYRKIEYFGSNSYTSESMFNNVYCDYVYFCMNEFASSSQYISNYGILPSGLINENILAVIPITTPQFVSTFADNADYIYKTRKYNGPIDIQKITIKLLNPQGRLVDLHNYDYGFNLQITTLYDNTIPYIPNYMID